jgi:PPOX class probable FMN-dependent enzyme
MSNAQPETITSEQELRAVLGVPNTAAATKERPRLDDLHRQWLGQSPFCLMATAGADGTCDVSPKGDPAGFTLVLDDTTIALPERPGNRRADGFLNMLGNPHIGLIYMIPGRTDTLRINGQATIVRDASWFDQLIVKGHRPLLAVVVNIEQVFFHCAKAFLRSGLWEPETWNPSGIVSRAEIAHRLERPNESIEELERYYGGQYAEGMYTNPA